MKKLTNITLKYKAIVAENPITQVVTYYISRIDLLQFKTNYSKFIELYQEYYDITKLKQKYTINDYNEFFKSKLHLVFRKLLLSNHQDQMKYAVMYCNNSNSDIALLARDVIKNYDRLLIENPQEIEWILNNQGFKIQELMQ